MKTIKDILLLGDKRLYKVSEPVFESELESVKIWVADLNNVMMEIRNKYNFGRGIAAPQINIHKQLIYINIDKPLVIINPEFTFVSPETFELWDDCMCFPGLLVKVKRHKKIKIKYLDENWEMQFLNAENDLAELIQHEYDHLVGVLATMRAINKKSFKFKPL